MDNYYTTMLYYLILYLFYCLELKFQYYAHASVYKHENLLPNKFLNCLCPSFNVIKLQFVTTEKCVIVHNHNYYNLACLSDISRLISEIEPLHLTPLCVYSSLHALQNEQAVMLVILHSYV